MCVFGFPGDSNAKLLVTLWATGGLCARLLGSRGAGSYPGARLSLRFFQVS